MSILSIIAFHLGVLCTVQNKCGSFPWAVGFHLCLLDQSYNQIRLWNIIWQDWKDTACVNFTCYSQNFWFRLIDADVLENNSRWDKLSSIDWQLMDFYFTRLYILWLSISIIWCSIVCALVFIIKLKYLVTLVIKWIGNFWVLFVYIKSFRKGE